MTDSCTTLILWNKPCQVLKFVQCFDKHCSFHLQGEYVLVGYFWQSYVGKAVGGKLDAMELIGGAYKGAAVQ
jgi:hypothetical protein